MNPNPDDRIPISAFLLGNTDAAKKAVKTLSKDIERLTSSTATALGAVCRWSAGKSKKYPLRHLQKIGANSAALERKIESLELMRESLKFTEKMRNRGNR